MPCSMYIIYINAYLLWRRWFLLVSLPGVEVVLVTLLQLLVEVGVRAKVERCLVLLVLDIEASSIGDKEDGYGCTALLLCAACHDGL